MGLKMLRKIQIGEEATKGTAVAATAALLGGLTMKESPTIHRPVEERATLAEFSRSIKVANLAELTFEGDATFEQILYPLHMGVLGSVSPPDANPISVEHDDNTIPLDLANTYDGVPATSETILAFTVAEDYICIRSATKFNAVRVDIGATPNAVASVISAIECLDGATNWVACTSVVDGTESPAGTSMAIDGVITFVPNALWGIDTFDAVDGYWIRISWSVDWTASTIINDFYVESLDRTWTFTPTMTAAGTFDSFTIEYGGDVEQWETEFCLARRVEISGAMNEPLRMRSEIFGRKMSVCNFTTAITPPTVESILTQKGRLYIDAETGTIGTTEKSATLIGFTYTINTGLGFKRYADGSIDFSNYSETVKGVDLRMTFAFNAGAETERLFFDGETLRLIRMIFDGSEAQNTDSTDSVVDAPLTADALTVEVNVPGNFSIGEIIKMQDEYCLITNIVANDLTITRGYNGSTPAEHIATTPIYIIQFKQLTLDFCGIYTDWATLSEREGEDIVEVTMSTQRGTTYTTLFQQTVVNNVRVLP